MALLTVIISIIKICAAAAAITSSTVTAQSFNCSSSGATCNSLVGYVSGKIITLSQIQTLFGINNLRSLLTANNLPVSTPPYQTVVANQIIRIPFQCLCTNGTGLPKNRLPMYKVVKDDGLYHISTEVFSGLVTYQQLQAVNNILNADLIYVGQDLWIPLPCSCDEVDGERVVHYGLVVPSGSTVEEIAQQYNTSVDTLLRLNGLSSSEDLRAGVLIDVPLEVQPGSDNPRKRQLWLIIGASVASLFFLILVSLLYYLRWRNHNFTGKNERSKDGTSPSMQSLMNELKVEAIVIDKISNWKSHHELPFLTLSSIENATNYFSNANKIGQGGFGPVYKGKLVNGKEIAVKRLSRSSRQGLEQFKNEVILVSRLQHRNLVKLLGCCIQGDERILIYEYLPNKSLDSFLFDATRRTLLDWKMRVCIIEGIAQGLQYLHKYSRLKIIDKDLKTTNILLNSDMNPKISDFGNARIFGENDSQQNTRRIFGTYGYMSPEYALDGLFSVKSDIFSFGVMMLEIISGKKNTDLNLLGYAWDLRKEGRGLEIMVHALIETCSTSEVMRYIQVGFLCVQESAVDRPNISEVLSMLCNEMVIIPAPKQLAFSAIVSVGTSNTSEISKHCSVNDFTISEVESR